MKKAPSSILLFEKATKRGYYPVWLTDYGVFSFTFKRKMYYAYQTKNYGNNQFSSWITQDKHATHIILDLHSFPAIPYCYSSRKHDVMDFFRVYHPIIAKPVTGEKSKNVYMIDKIYDIEQLDYSMTLFEQYIEGNECRYLLIDGKVVAVQQKKLAPDNAHPWRKVYTNLTSDHHDSRMSTLATQIHTIIPQRLLAVDFILDSKNTLWVLELNSMPGLWSFLHPDHGDPIDLTDQVLDLIIDSQTTY